MTTLVQYYIPEDKEDQEKLNAFIIYKDVDSLRINEIKENFPLPGEYYFRFKYKFQNNNVWIDLMTDVIPKYEGKIIMKVSRIFWQKETHENKAVNYSEFPDMI